MLGPRSNIKASFREGNQRKRLLGNYCGREREREKSVVGWRRMEMGNLRLVMVAIVMVAGMANLVEGQDSTPSCAADLVPCADYLNSTNPPPSCCTPLKEAVATQLQCLCGLLNDPSLFQSMGINITQALQLSEYCGTGDTTTACLQYETSSPSPSPSVSPAPATGSPSSGVGKLAWNGMSCLLLFLASMVVIQDLCVL